MIDKKKEKKKALSFYLCQPIIWPLTWTYSKSVVSMYSTDRDPKRFTAGNFFKKLLQNLFSSSVCRWKQTICEFLIFCSFVFFVLSMNSRSLIISHCSPISWRWGRSDVGTSEKATLHMTVNFRDWSLSHWRCTDDWSHTSTEEVDTGS